MEAHGRRGIVLLIVYLCGPLRPVLEFRDMISCLLGEIRGACPCAGSPKEKRHLVGYRRRGGVEGLAIDASPSAEPSQVARVGWCELKGRRMLEPAALGREARVSKQIANASPDSSNPANNNTVARIKGFGR